MNPLLLLIIILFPFVSGLLLVALRGRSSNMLAWSAFAITVLTSAGCCVLLIFGVDGALDLVRFAPALTLSLRLDGLGRFFVGIVSALWPLTVLYARAYMRHETHLPMFFGFFTVSYGATLGVAMAGNLFTMYCFYELLTLSTVPLVLQPMTKAAVRATRMYFLYSIGGAAFAFASMVFLLANGATGPFESGGSLAGHLYYSNDVTYLFWLFGFLGFGVKAALFPLHAWLPRASVAPTPVTALLHAVAVVKSGAFAVIRLTYCCFGIDLLSGSWAQTAAILLASFTIVYGSSIALKESHFKRRLAYSTVANLSYILLGAVLMTPAGLSAGLMHMAAHACIKILAFFCAGAVLHQTGRTNIYELDGLGRRMPVTFVCFTFSAFALTGLPPFFGFVSKWQLLTAAAASSGIVYVGAGALLLSALLTAIYMLTCARRAWFPARDSNLDGLETVHEASWEMLVPMVLLAVGTLLCGMFAKPILAVTDAIASGLV